MSGILASELDIKELAQIPEKLQGCGATLVYLDLFQCSFFDSRITSTIIRIHQQLEKEGCQFELRVDNPQLLSFFKDIELDKIVTIIDQNATASPDLFTKTRSN